MIAVDTSALMAIVLGEATADRCSAALATETKVLISAVTLAEALIVAARRAIAEEMERLIDALGFDIVPVSPAAARRIAAIYAQWGRGSHAAALNFGDCFAYEVAKHHACPLLFVGDDFSQTDVESAV